MGSRRSTQRRTQGGARGTHPTRENVRLRRAERRRTRQHHPPHPASTRAAHAPRVRFPGRPPHELPPRSRDGPPPWPPDPVCEEPPVPQEEGREEDPPGPGGSSRSRGRGPGRPGSGERDRGERRRRGGERSRSLERERDGDPRDEGGAQGGGRPRLAMNRSAPDQAPHFPMSGVSVLSRGGPGAPAAVAPTPERECDGDPRDEWRPMEGAPPMLARDPSAPDSEPHPPVPPEAPPPHDDGPGAPQAGVPGARRSRSLERERREGPLEEPPSHDDGPGVPTAGGPDARRTRSLERERREVPPEDPPRVGGGERSLSRDRERRGEPAVVGAPESRARRAMSQSHCPSPG